MKKIAVNNIELAYERHGRGTPLVLLHGFPLDHSIWADVVPLLENDFDLILPDLRGFGQSTTVSSPYSMSEMAADLAGLLDALGLEKAAIAGHSMGGYVALAFAKAFPDRISGLALVGSQAAGDTPERKEGRYKTASEVDAKGVQVIADGMADKLSVKQPVRDFVRSLILQQSTLAVTGALKTMAEREDLSPLITSFTGPIVLIHGSVDDLIPVERAQEIKSLKPGAHLIELSGAGHMPMMEEPSETAAALKILK